MENNPWFPMVALMMLPALGSMHTDPRVKALLDTVTQNEDGSFNTDEFVKGMMELLQEEAKGLNIEEAIDKLKEHTHK